MALKCYRCWYRDGTARLVDAESSAEARRVATTLAAFDCGDRDRMTPSDRAEAVRHSTVARVECLDH